jgi:hypothetical protein
LVAMARRPTWILTNGGRGAFSVTERGQRGQFPLAESLGPGRARAQASTCGPAHPQPSHPARRAQGGAVELGAEKGKVEDDRGEGADRWGPAVSEGHRKKKG